MLTFNLFLILNLKMTVERSKSQRSFLTLTFIVNSVPKKLCLKIFVNFKYLSILIIMCFKHVKCSCFSSRERTGWLTISTYLSLQPLLLFQKRLQMVQVSILIITTNKRLKCCFFSSRERTGWLTMSTDLSLQPLLLFQKRLQIVQVAALLQMQAQNFPHIRT